MRSDCSKSRFRVLRFPPLAPSGYPRTSNTQGRILCAKSATAPPRNIVELVLSRVSYEDCRDCWDTAPERCPRPETGPRRRGSQAPSRPPPAPLLRLDEGEIVIMIVIVVVIGRDGGKVVARARGSGLGSGLRVR